MSRLTRTGGEGHADYSAVNLREALDFEPLYGDAGTAPLPPLDYAEAEDEVAAAAQAEFLSYELPPEDWHPVDALGQPSNPIVRFVDGSLATTTAGSIVAEGVRRPVLVSTLGAAELFLDERRLHRPEVGYRILVTASFISNGVPLRLIDALREQLAVLGIELIDFETSDMTTNFDILKSRTWNLLREEMEGLEKEIVLSRPYVSTLADGLLDRRLTTAEVIAQPVAGMVKRNLRQYLPDGLLPCLYRLEPGQRSPAFVIHTGGPELLSWYVKVAGVNVGPGSGLIRLAYTRDYLESNFTSEARFQEISAISRQVFSIRCREESYARYLVSLEPIVRLEDQLHALLPGVERFATRLRNHIWRGRP
ncbi:MAG: hypothetical protein KY429_10625 [Actinobacteria bacterium]|nr:hypothetical protein [Actinomycetota bacterium]